MKCFSFFCDFCRAFFKSLTRPHGKVVRCPSCGDVGPKELLDTVEVESPYGLSIGPKEE